MASSSYIQVALALLFTLPFGLGQNDTNLNNFLPFMKFRIYEFPPTFNSPINGRSIAVVNSTDVFSTLEFQLFRLTKYSSKLYIEMHPATFSEFIFLLNLTVSYTQDFLWMPCILLYWPEIAVSVEIAEELVLSIVEELDKINFPLDSEIFVAFEISQNSHFSEVHNYDNELKYSPIKVVLCDLYKSEILSTSQFCHIHHLDDRPLSVSESYFFYHPVSTRRRDLNGITLHIVAQHDPNYEERLSIREFINGTIEFTKGMCVDMLIALQISMNFSYVPVKGNGWAALFPNGTWTGMAAQLINKEADLSVAQTSMIMMIDALSGVSFLQPSSAGHFIALFKQPSSLNNLLLSEFSMNMWLVYFVTWVIVVILVSFIFFVQKKINKCLYISDIAFSKDVFFWGVTTICGKGWYIVPLHLCFRVIFLVASVMAFCIYAAYSSQLTVILVTEVLPIKSFSELTMSSLEVFTDKWLPVARNIIEKVYSQRGVQIPKENSLYTVDEGLLNVITKEPSLAFVTFADTVSTVFYKMNLTDNYFCDSISSVKVATQKTQGAMFVKRDSPLKEILNYNVVNMVEKGIVKRLNKQYEDRTQIQCAPKANNYRGGLSLKDVWIPFILLATGFMLCLLNLLFESLLFNVQTISFDLCHK